MISMQMCEEVQECLIENTYTHVMLQSNKLISYLKTTMTLRQFPVIDCYW